MIGEIVSTDDREHVYDTEMAPLVSRLIEIAKRAGIPLVLSAGMVRSDGEPMCCSTLICHGDRPDRLAGVENRFDLAMAVIRGHSGFNTAAELMITRHHPKSEVQSEGRGA